MLEDTCYWHTLTLKTTFPLLHPRLHPRQPMKALVEVQISNMNTLQRLGARKLREFSKSVLHSIAAQATNI